MRANKKEYSKVVTTWVVATFSFVAVAFIVFVCYEMHRLQDLSPVAYIGVGIIGLLTLTLKFYMRRAEAKSQTDLEWEKTKRMTEYREKHPEYFTQGVVAMNDTLSDDGADG